MKSKLVKSSFICLLLLLRLQTSGQTPSSAFSISNITPPSPTAYELGKYGQAEVGLFTGTNSATIPLYTYRTRNLSLPLSLNYSSNGIKVDELGSNVGLSWSFHAGGVISRMVRDLPDDIRTDFFPEGELHQPGGAASPHVMQYFNNAATNPDIDTETDLFMFNFNGYSGKFVMDNDHKIVLLPKQDLQIEAYLNGSENGYKIITADGIEYIFCQQEFSRNRVSGTTQTPPDKYAVTAWYLSRIKHPLGDEISFKYNESNSYQYIASQQQNLIAVPFQSICNGANEPVNYSSVGPLLNYNMNVIGNRLTEISSNNPHQEKILITYATSHPETNSGLISSIKVIDRSSQELERFDLSYFSTANKRIFLQKVVTKDPSKTYQMEYINPAGLPQRLSFSQDHWGYYNGKNNTYLFPNVNQLDFPVPDMLAVLNIGGDKSPDSTSTQLGLLKRFSYPTGGYSDYSYEANTNRGKKKITQPEQSFSLIALTNSQTSSNSVSTNLTNIKFEQEIKINLHIEYNAAANCPGDDDIHTTATLRVIDLTNPSSKVILYQKPSSGQSVVNNPFSYSPYSGAILPLYMKGEAGHNYQLTVSVTRYCIRAGAYGSYIPGDATLIDVNKIVGGMRIKRIEVYDPVSGAKQSTRYYYGKKDGLLISSAAEEIMPRYTRKRYNRIDCVFGDTWDLVYYEESSNSLNALYNSIGTHTTNYQYVTVSDGGDKFENGGEEHEFVIEPDIPGNPIVGDPIPSAPWTNLGRFNGKEKSVKTFRKNGTNVIVLKEQNNTYQQDNRYYEEVFGYKVEQRCKKLNNNNSVTYTCKQEDVNKQWIFYRCNGNHSLTVYGATIDVGHTWLLMGFGGRTWRCIAPGAKNDTLRVDHRCKALGVGGQLINPNAMENLDIMEYRSISTWEYLSSSTTIVYDQNGGNGSSTTTYYEYGNPVHMQATAIATILENSAASNLRASYTRRYFLQDYTYPGNVTGTALALKTMADKHIWNTPIEELNYHIIASTSYLVGGRLTTYKMNGASVVKDKDYSLKHNNSTIYQDLIWITPGTINSSGQFIYDSHYEELNAYNRYDTVNNLIEVKDRKDTYSLIREPNTGDVWAKVLHATTDQTAYSSFEHGNNPKDFTNWNYNNANIYTDGSPLPLRGTFNGDRCYKFPITGDYIQNRINLNQSQRYKISFWGKNGSVNVNAFTPIGASSRAAVLLRTGPTRMGWTYYEGYFSNSTIVQLRGTGLIDELRLYPSNAFMETTVYKQGIGIWSKCNENNQNTFWEYDQFNRLKLIRDQDGYILKKNEYKYQHIQN